MSPNRASPRQNIQPASITLNIPVHHVSFGIPELSTFVLSWFFPFLLILPRLGQLHLLRYRCNSTYGVRSSSDKQALTAMHHSQASARSKHYCWPGVSRWVGLWVLYSRRHSWCHDHGSYKSCSPRCSRAACACCGVWLVHQPGNTPNRACCCTQSQ